MKKLFFATLWITVAVAAYMFGQPIITLVMAILAATEIACEIDLRYFPVNGRGSAISKAMTPAHPAGSHRHDWFALL